MGLLSKVRIFLYHLDHLIARSPRQNGGRTNEASKSMRQNTFKETFSEGDIKASKNSRADVRLMKTKQRRLPPSNHNENTFIIYRVHACACLRWKAARIAAYLFPLARLFMAPMRAARRTRTRAHPLFAPSGSQFNTSRHPTGAPFPLFHCKKPRDMQFPSFFLVLVSVRALLSIGRPRVSTQGSNVDGWLSCVRSGT